jgi:hypothetical protein
MHSHPSPYSFIIAVHSGAYLIPADMSPPLSSGLNVSCFTVHTHAVRHHLDRGLVTLALVLLVTPSYWDSPYPHLLFTQPGPLLERAEHGSTLIIHPGGGNVHVPVKGVNSKCSQECECPWTTSVCTAHTLR